MKKINAENLKNELEIRFYPVYFLLGNNVVSIKDSKNYILYKAKKFGFLESFTVNLDSNISLEKAFKICINQNLFSKKQILIFHISEKNYLKKTIHNLNKIFRNINKEILVILHSNLSLKEMENYLWFKQIKNDSILIECFNSEKYDFYHWIIRKEERLDLRLHEDMLNSIRMYANNCNLLNLRETLKQFSIFSKKDSSKRILRNIIFSFQENCFANFEIFHFVKKILLKDKISILKFFLNSKFFRFIDLISLFFLFKSIAINLIFIKKKCHEQFLKNFSFHKRICKQYGSILMNISQDISLEEIHFIFFLLEKTEFYIRENHKKFVWINLCWIIFLLCGINNSYFKDFLYK